MAEGVSRRAFVTALISVPVALSVQPVIGESEYAGGFYAPVPSNLADYVTFSDPFEPVNQRVRLVRAIAHVAWAKPGARFAQIQIFGGTIVLADHNPATEMAQRENLLRSMRALFNESHYPGWFSVLRLAPDGGFDEEGFTTMRSWHEWTRIGHVRYIKRGEMTGIQVAA